LCFKVGGRAAVRRVGKRVLMAMLMSMSLLRRASRSVKMGVVVMPPTQLTRTVRGLGMEVAREGREV
jgi:hypothetical protein